MMFSNFSPFRNYFFLLASVLLLSSCSLGRMARLAERKQQVTAAPDVLEVSGSRVFFQVNAQVPAEVLKKDHTYALDIYYEYGSKQIEPIARLQFKTGEFVYTDGKPTITRELSFPYTPAKAPGKLMVQGIASTKKGRTKVTQPRQIASGIITTSKLVVRNNEIQFANEDYVFDESEPTTLTFYFDEGSAKLRRNESTINVDILEEFIRDNHQTQRVEILATHSPEKEDYKNPSLARKRAETMRNFYQKHLDQSYYTASPKSVKFDVKPIVRNWNTFLKKIQTSALSADEVEEILTIVNGPGTYAQKADKLQTVQAAEYLQLYVYPMLRFADVKISYTREKKQDYEIFLLSRKIIENKADADALTEEELRYSATLTPLLSEKLKIYEAAVQNTRKWKAYNNLGVVYLQIAEKELRPKVKNALLQKATENLLYAGHRNPTSETFYNLAAAHHIRGNYLEALQNYDYAIKLGGQLEMLQKLFADKSALEIEIGQLDDAVASLDYAGESYQTYMNKGLVYLLKGNYEGATEYYSKALEYKPNDALANYSLAITAARANDANQMAKYLRNATRSDKTFVQRAIDDLEFRRYHKTAVFEDALK